MSRTRFLPLFGLLVALLGGTPVFGVPATPMRLQHWTRFPVRVFVATHNAGEDGAARVALAGFDEWVRATGGAVRYVLVDAPSRADLTVRFTAGESVPGQPGVSGVTTVSTRAAVLVKAQMRLAFGEATPAEFQSVAAHEFGHALGIGGHSADPDDLMAPVQVRVFGPDGTPLSQPVRRPSAGDLDTLRLCYPRLLAAAAPRTDHVGGF